MPRIRVFLTGPFRIESEDGRILTPRTAKERGLFCLLLTSDKAERSRVWLKDKLWSDRGRAQANSSLRQALSQIRKSLGAAEDILVADRVTVSLDMSRIDVHDDPGEEFAEGLDVRDAEFDTWLSSTRATRAGALDEDDSPPEPVPPAGRPTLLRSEDVRRSPAQIFLTVGPNADPALAWAEIAASDLVADLVGMTYTVPVIRGEAAVFNGPAWCIHVSALRAVPGKVTLRILLADHISGRHYWAGHRSVEANGAPPVDHPAIRQMVYELVEAIGEAIFAEHRYGATSDDPDLLCRIAIRKLFTMQADQVEEADRLFARAYELEPRGLYLAWRAHLREVQHIERLRLDRDLLREEGREFTVRAMAAEPNNAMVLALSSVSRLYLDGDISGGLEMAQRSILLQKSNPMGWWALGSARLFSGELELSLKDAQMANFLFQKSQLSYWAEGLLAGSLLAMGRFSEASDLLERVAGKCTHYRPGLRNLLALHTQAEDWDKAEWAARRLKAIEPGFSIDRFVHDEAYPASLLRRTEGLDIARIAHREV